MKKLIFVPILLAAIVALTMQCVNKQTANAPKATAAVPMKQTHKEAADTLLTDAEAPLKPLIFKPLTREKAMEILATKGIDSLFFKEYPNNGFYGDDRYRIEFWMPNCMKNPADPTVYLLSGKTRYKKNINGFEGEIKVNQISEVIDPNIDTAEVNAMAIQRIYAAQGTFEIREDPTLKSSGVFRGTIKFDFSVSEDNHVQLWYYSQGLPSGGAGFRMDGTWTSNTQPNVSKPLILADDLFRIANDILKDFSYGEREIEINKQYRSLGWESFWENDEWWQKAEKPKM